MSKKKIIKEKSFAIKLCEYEDGTTGLAIGDNDMPIPELIGLLECIISIKKQKLINNFLEAGINL